jgi:hypothetical protein
MPQRERQKQMKRTIDGWIEAYLRYLSVAEQVGPPGAKPWQLSPAQREQIDSLAGDFKPPASRNGPARERAARALKALTKAGDDLRAAQKLADVHPPPKVGENMAAQRIVARRSPEGAVAALGWIRAEIHYLERYEIAIRADRDAGVISVPRRLVPEADEELVRELHHRVAGLCVLAREIEDSPIFVAQEHDADRFCRLVQILEDVVQRVREADGQKLRRNSQQASVKRAVNLARGTYASTLASELLGVRSEELIEELVRQQLSQRCPTVLGPHMSDDLDDRGTRWRIGASTDGSRP